MASLQANEHLVFLCCYVARFGRSGLKLMVNPVESMVLLTAAS